MTIELESVITLVLVKLKIQSFWHFFYALFTRTIKHELVVVVFLS